MSEVHPDINAWMERCRKTNSTVNEQARAFSEAYASLFDASGTNRESLGDANGRYSVSPMKISVTTPMGSRQAEFDGKVKRELKQEEQKEVEPVRAAPPPPPPKSAVPQRTEESDAVSRDTDAVKVEEIRKMAEQNKDNHYEQVTLQKEERPTKKPPQENTNKGCKCAIF